jgi:hypothetical protein
MWKSDLAANTTVAASIVFLLACGTAAPPAGPRHPEKKAPEAARSASDGEVLGAHGQSPSDTLEGSPTNEHAAPGWSGEAATPLAPGAGEPEPEDCLEAPKQQPGAAVSPAGDKKKRPCPPAEER